MPFSDIHRKKKAKNFLLLAILAVLILGLYTLTLSKFGAL